MKFIYLFALIATPSFAAAPAVPPVKTTACYASVKNILQGEYTKFQEVDGVKIGSELVDVTNFVNLPTRTYHGMNGDHHFGLVGYARVNFMGDAVSHLTNYTVSAACVYNAEAKTWVLDDTNLDQKMNIEDVSMRDMDFER